MPELAFTLFDCDTHCYETRDAFTRFMPADKIETAVAPIRLASGKEVVLANNRVVTALEQDLDKACVPGSLAEMLRQRASGNPADAERFYEDIRPEYVDRTKRLAEMDSQQVERAVLFPGGWGLVRASNTGPVLVLRFEADTAEHLAAIQAEMQGRLAMIIAEVTAETTTSARP